MTDRRRADDGPSVGEWLERRGHPVSRLLVTGATGWTDGALVASTLSACAGPARATGGSFRVITGQARGADAFARDWAEREGVHLLATSIGAHPTRDAVHRYNEWMLSKEPDLVLAFKRDFGADWTSAAAAAGTEHMCRIAAEAGVPVLLNARDWLTTDPVAATPPSVIEAPDVRVNGTLVRVQRGDITKLSVDVIVNAANASMLGGGGVDGAIHRAAGSALLDECRELAAKDGPLATGDAVMTGAGDLAAQHVVHTVGPVWSGNAPEAQDAELASCYAKSLELAAAAGARSIAFPCISTGVYGFPPERAADVAWKSVISALESGAPMDAVAFVCFDARSFEIYSALSMDRMRRDA